MEDGQYVLRDYLRQRYSPSNCTVMVVDNMGLNYVSVLHPLHFCSYHVGDERCPYKLIEGYALDIQNGNREDTVNGFWDICIHAVMSFEVKTIIIFHGPKVMGDLKPLSYIPHNIYIHMKWYNNMSRIRVICSLMTMERLERDHSIRSLNIGFIVDNMQA